MQKKDPQLSRWIFCCLGWFFLITACGKQTPQGAAASAEAVSIQEAAIATSVSKTTAARGEESAVLPAQMTPPASPQTEESNAETDPILPAELPTGEPDFTRQPTADPAPAYPSSFYIKGVTGHVQVYELSCEASAAVDWANFFGKTIYEFNFQNELPVSDNPDIGYVGDPTTDGWGQIPPYSYGVHADPVAKLLLEYGLPAESRKNYSLDALREKISQSKPVIVWIIGNMEYSVPVEFTDSQGRKTIVAPYEHVVIVTGYDQHTIRYMTNGRYYDVPNEVFLTSWGVLGNMAVIHE